MEAFSRKVQPGPERVEHNRIALGKEHFLNVSLRISRLLSATLTGVTSHYIRHWIGAQIETWIEGRSSGTVSLEEFENRLLECNYATGWNFLTTQMIDCD